MKIASSVKSHFVSAGDILREHIRNNTSIGAQVKEYQAKGVLAPDHLVAVAVQLSLQEEIHEQLTHETLGVGFFLDGFPRNLKQAKIISPQSRTSDAFPTELQVHFAISIDVPDSICIKKMLGRRRCSRCHESINMCSIEPDTDFGFYMPPMLPTDPLCSPDKCSDKWTRRVDDTEEIIQRRLVEFHQETRPVLDYYESLDRLINFIPLNGIDDIGKLKDLILKRVLKHNNESIKT